jgi:hypothetical protein
MQNGNNMSDIFQSGNLNQATTNQSMSHEYSCSNGKWKHGYGYQSN